MISKEEIKKLADLARIEIGEEEIESLRGEMDSILEYVGQIKKVTDNVEKTENPLLVVRGLKSENTELFKGGVINVTREDQNPTEPETYNQELIAEFPKSENNYLKVKKIL